MVPPRACPLNGKLEGSHVDDMNCLTLVSSNIVKSCLCTRLRDVVNPRKIGVCEYLEHSEIAKTQSVEEFYMKLFVGTDWEKLELLQKCIDSRTKS